MKRVWHDPSPVTEPYEYTGPDYTDELRDEATTGCVCFDAATAEWAPQPCQHCQQREVS